MSLTLITTWILAHGLAALAITSAVGTLAGVVEKSTSGKVSNVAGTIAGGLIDVVKIASQLYALLGGQPPSSPMGKRLCKGVFDDAAGGGPPIVLGKGPDSTKKVEVPRLRFGFLTAIGLALALYFAVSIGGLVSCKSLAPAAAPSGDAVACGSGYVIETVMLNETPTLQGFEAKCASKIVGDLTTIGLQIFEELVSSYAMTPPESDAGKMKALGPNPYLEHAMALRNAYAAKAAAK